MLSDFSAILLPVLRPTTAKNIMENRIKLARRLQIESGILWPVFGMLSAAYIGLLGRVLRVW
jgi:hypothetical protein